MRLLKESDLHPYQKNCIAHIMENHSAGLFLDMGLGKTVTTLTAINKLMFEELEINRTLVIAPKRVTENVWTEEVKLWEHLTHLKLVRIIGTEKQRLNAAKTKGDIYLISRDNIAWLCGIYGGMKLPFDMLVVDESSSFKNQKSQRFKALRKTLGSFRRVVILTGTPAPNTLLDLWAQIFLLDRGARLGRLVGKYRDEYFTPNKRNGEIIYSYKLKDGAESKIHEKIDDICISMKASDYLDLPPRQNNFINITLPPNILKKYNDFEKECVLEMLESEKKDDSYISVANAAGLSNKLLQFAGGAVYYWDDDLLQLERFVHEVHKLKLDEAEEIVESTNKPVLIFWNFQHERDRLLKRLKKYEPVQLKTSEHINSWNRGEIRVMMMHPASGGHGLNLQAGGNTILWYSLTWSLELYQQANARLDRQGQTENVIVHHLIAKGTIDEDVLKSIEKKTATQDDLLNAIKARIKKYSK